MATRIEHDVTPPPATDPSARQELDQLVQTLHEHGVLRFANDVVASNHELLRIVLAGLGKPGTLDALQNASALAMAFSALPPERFYQVMFAAKEAIEEISRHRHEESAGDASQQADLDRRSSTRDAAPGITGLYRLLNDEELWHAIKPLAAGLRAFSQRLDRPVDKPVTDFTGKPTEGP